MRELISGKVLCNLILLSHTAKTAMNAIMNAWTAQFVTAKNVSTSQVAQFVTAKNVSTSQVAFNVFAGRISTEVVVKWQFQQIHLAT